MTEDDINPGFNHGLAEIRLADAMLLLPLAMATLLAMAIALAVALLML